MMKFIPPTVHLLQLTFIVMISSQLLTSCISSAPEIEYGLQPEHSGYVPARIAVVPCQTWPAGARYKTLPLSNAKELEIKGICRQLDSKVLESFQDQPYMKGFSPKYVTKLLDKANKEGFLNKVSDLWKHLPEDCAECKTEPAFYTVSIVARNEWQTWLTEFSKTIKNADAILMPFVSSAYTNSYNDRGLLVAERGASVALLLVDTNNGLLLWAGGRKAVIPNKKLKSNTASGETIEAPSWKALFDRLLVEDLWREFPGRQVF